MGGWQDRRTFRPILLWHFGGMSKNRQKITDRQNHGRTVTIIFDDMKIATNILNWTDWKGNYCRRLSHHWVIWNQMTEVREIFAIWVSTFNNANSFDNEYTNHVYSFRNTARLKHSGNIHSFTFSHSNFNNNCKSVETTEMFAKRQNRGPIHDRM